MNLDDFEKPVRILVGLGFPREVRGVWDAHQLLSDWPAFTRNRSHHVALRACEAALRGDIDAETARAAFVAFARRNHLLLPDVDEAIAARRTPGTTFPGASA
jgi:Protein of unknown function (DUF982)